MAAFSIETVNALHNSIVKEIGQPSNWPVWREGWNRADLALLDAIYSARQKYETTVRPRVKKWESLHPLASESELEYLTTIDEQAIREVMGNNYLPGVRIPGTKIGMRKSVGVIEVAKSLCEQGLNSSIKIQEVALKDKNFVLELIRRTKGIGSATSTYFLMLLGVDGVKVDTLLGSWVRQQLQDTRLSDDEVSELVAHVARERFERTSTELDYAIWSHESELRRGLT